jgi:class II flagellar assembly regulator FliX
MRIERATGANAVTAGKTVRRSGADGFTLAEGEPAREPTATAGVRSIGGIDVLVALQGIEEPGERRRRAVARGRTALDVLDAVKIGLLAGALDAATVIKLKSAVSGLKDCSGDPALDGVLAEIELRVEVELAKMGPAPIL